MKFSGERKKLRSTSCMIIGESRVSGDGYFGSAMLDPDEKRIECVYKE